MSFTTLSILPLTVIAVGAVLLGYKIIADNEPGAVPLLLLVIGSGSFYLLQRKYRLRNKTRPY